MDRRLIAQRYFLEPIHHIAQMIFADSEPEGEISQRVSIPPLPAEPARQRPLMKTFLLRVSADLAFRHP